MKAKIKLNLAEGLGAGWVLIRSEMLPFMMHSKFPGNMTMSALVYYFEGPLTMATVWYNILFRSGKCNIESFDVMALMLDDSCWRLPITPGCFLKLSINFYIGSEHIVRYMNFYVCGTTPLMRWCSKAV